MGFLRTAAGRGLRIATFFGLLLFAGAFLCLHPSPVAAQDYESMMPKTLQHEVHKAQLAYHDAMEAVNAAENERLAKTAAGAGEADLHALDVKVGQLVTKAEKLKVQSDYLEELYKTKQQEYKSK